MENNKEQIEFNCNGDGSCLYQKPNTYICKYKCELIKCPNYIICGESAPQITLNDYYGLCYNCSIYYKLCGIGKGILKIFDNIECPICLENKQSVELPKCDHTLCIECFKSCWYGDGTQKRLARCPLCRK